MDRDLARMRGGLLHADTVDTLWMPNFPRNDSLFWIAKGSDRVKELDGKPTNCWNLRAYKGSLKDQQLVLVCLDSLSTSKWHAAKAMLEYQGDALVHC